METAISGAALHEQGVMMKVVKKEVSDHLKGEGGQG